MDIDSHLPLTEPTFFILLALVPSPQHGYAIMKKTTTLSDGRVRLSTSTLYGAVKRLLDQGLIDRSEEKSGVENGRERKAYQLTEYGRRILSAEMVRMQSMITLAQEADAGASL